MIHLQVNISVVGKAVCLQKCLTALTMEDEEQCTKVTYREPYGPSRRTVVDMLLCAYRNRSFEKPS